jgi:CTP synthase (UTP-ammonia lyase)
MSTRMIALVGDYSERHTAHRAIPRALELARDLSGAQVSWEWVPTRELRNPEGDLAAFSAVWIVPASPYENTEGALGAARWAREGRHPLLGTCGGFQHALLEFARNVAGVADADHAETNPGGSALLITPLSCSHVEKTAAVHFEEGSLLASSYGTTVSTEGYRCNYGLNPAYRRTLETAGLRFTAWDGAGDVRGAELPGHPFFAGVLFQPERAALRGEVPALVLAFAKAAAGLARP